MMQSVQTVLPINYKLGTSSTSEESEEDAKNGTDKHEQFSQNIYAREMSSESRPTLQISSSSSSPMPLIATSTPDEKYRKMLLEVVGFG